MRKNQRIPQPPIDPQGRPTERRPWWPGALLTVLALGAVVWSLGLTYPTQNGSRISHTQLVKLVTVGGATATSPAPTTGPATAASQAGQVPRINVVEKPADACPT